MRTLLSMLLLLSTTFAASADPTAEDALRKRAADYWELKLKVDPKLVDFYVPVEKGGPAPGEISEFGAVQFTSAEITSIEIEGDAAWVTSRNAVVLVGANRQISEAYRTRDIRQQWTRVDGEWYRVLTKGEDVFEKFSRAAVIQSEARQRARAERARAERERVEREKAAGREAGTK